MHGRDGIGESEFNMWRAVFAFTYVDNVLSLEEQELLHVYLKKVPFSKDQLAILKEDLLHPKDVVSMYKKITRKEDKERFCVLARAIVWCEGDMSGQEKAILKKVSCFEDDEEEMEILESTRDHPYLKTYYQQYAKAGMMGILDMPHKVELRA
jgi:hypothetical protein